MKKILIAILLISLHDTYAQTAKEMYITEHPLFLVCDPGHTFSLNLDPFIRDIEKMALQDTLFYKEKRDSSLVFRVCRSEEGFNILQKEIASYREFLLNDKLVLQNEKLYAGKILLNEWHYNAGVMTSAKEYNYQGKLIGDLLYDRRGLKDYAETSKATNAINVTRHENLLSVRIEHSDMWIHLFFEDQVLLLVEIREDGCLIQQKGTFDKPLDIYHFSFGRLETMEGWKLSNGQIYVNNVLTLEK